MSCLSVLTWFCDVGPQEEDLFRKIYQSLNPGGRLVNVEQFAKDPTHPPPQRRVLAFLASLANPQDELTLRTIDLIKSRCAHIGFQEISCQPVPSNQDIRWLTGWVALIARNQTIDPEAGRLSLGGFQ